MTIDGRRETFQQVRIVGYGGVRGTSKLEPTIPGAIELFIALYM